MISNNIKTLLTKFDFKYKIGYKYLSWLIMSSIKNKCYQNAHSIILNCLSQYKFEWNWCCDKVLNGSIVDRKSDPFRLHNTYFDVHLYYAGHLCFKRSKNCESIIGSSPSIYHTMRIHIYALYICYIYIYTNAFKYVMRPDTSIRVVIPSHEFHAICIVIVIKKKKRMDWTYINAF